MAMNIGGHEADRHLLRPNMNVTPLVDIVLVLLIIFIVITPQLNRKLWVHTPKQEKKELEQPQPQDPNPPLVMRISEDRRINVNGVMLGFDEVPQRLRRMFAARDDHVLFFDAADGVDYGFVVAAMDQARAGGAVTIAPLGDKLGSGGEASADAAAAPAAGP
jgi:biopolymer transport protein ExbD/biopolymer transport protein TolR